MIKPRQSGLLWSGLLLALACWPFYLWLTLRGDFKGLLADSYIYLAMAREFALGRDADSRLLGFIFDSYPFPPLYPLSLALFGAGGQSPIATYTLNAALMSFVVGFAYVWQRAVGLPLTAALLSALLLAIMPVTLLSAMNVLSEPLYVLLTMGAAIRLSGARLSSRHWRDAAVLVGLATLTRSAGVTALAALVWVWVLQRGWQSSRWSLLPALALPGVWGLIQHCAGFGTYAAPAVFDKGMLATISVNLHALAVAAVGLFDPIGARHSAILVGSLAVVALPVWGVRLVRARFDAWYLLIYAGLLLLWPHPAHAARFLFAVLPLLLAYAALVGEWVARSTIASGMRNALTALPPLALLICALPGSLGITTTVLGESRPEYLAAVRAPFWYGVPPRERPALVDFSVRAEHVMRAIGELPPEACVATGTIPAESALFYGRRQVLDLARMRRSPAAVDQILAACPYVLMAAAIPTPEPPGIGPMYPLQMIADRLEPIWIERSPTLGRNSPVLLMLAKVAPKP
jgi:hypothetical protein